jgi:hypothetical protein
MIVTRPFYVISTHNPQVCLEEEQLFPLETGIWGWTAAYCKMNDDLIARAKVINSGGRPPPQDSETAKQERKRLDGEFRESLDAVRRHVTELCPKLALAAGCITSTMLTVSGFLLPYFMGKLYDGVIETAKKPSSAGAHSLNEHLPLLITIASIMVFNYLGSILVGIFFAIAAHTTVKFSPVLPLPSLSFLARTFIRKIAEWMPHMAKIEIMVDDCHGGPPARGLTSALFRVPCSSNRR